MRRFADVTLSEALVLFGLVDVLRVCANALGAGVRDGRSNDGFTMKRCPCARARCVAVVAVGG